MLDKILKQISLNKNDVVLEAPFIFTSHPLLLSLDLYSVLNLGDCCQTIYESKIKLNDALLILE